VQEFERIEDVGVNTEVADWQVLIARLPAERERECVCVCVCEEGHDGADCDGHTLLQRHSWGS